LPWLLPAAALLALGVTTVNLLTWPRGRVGVVTERVSVLIPARNEEGKVGRCVRSVLAAPVHEVLVYDDGSTDGTRAELDAIDDPRLRVLDGVPFPPGWIGKPHACHRLGLEATGDLLLFLDADVELADGGLQRLVDLATRWRAGIVTAMPHQRTLTIAESLVVPLLHVTYASWLPQVLVPLVPLPSVLAANGQVLMVRREVHDHIGGFEAVRTEVVDDMAFCRRAKRLGERVVFADGELIATCRMYRSAGEVWSGFSKNLYEGLGSPLGLVLAGSLYLWAFVLPWAALAVPSLAAPAAVGVAANVVQRAALAVRHRHPVVTVLLHPLGVVALLAIAANSWWWSRRGAIRWAGRTYPAKQARAG
jgi:chlorobactene glucosyltransferase